MGKKVNPKIIRMGIIKTWPSVWFEQGDNYVRNVKQDVQIRKYLIREFRDAGIDRVEIVRTLGKIDINVTTGKPGVIIGRGGTGVDDLKKKLHRQF